MPHENANDTSITSNHTTTTTTTPDDTTSICDKVRRSCTRWMEDTGRLYVKIHPDALASVASKIRQHKVVEWDEEQWHYEPPATWPLELRRERVALYILALDAINFCFWPSSSDSYEYVDLACTLTAMAQADHTNVEERLASDNNNDNNVSSSYSSSFLLSAPRLRDVTPSELRELFATHHATGKCPPDMDRRCALWNEVGQVLCDHYHGSAWELVQSAQGSAVQLVQTLVDRFPGFRDVVDFDDNHNDNRFSVYLLKRAQICVGDWEAALPGVEFQDKDQLTTFADYRLPQLLRHWNVLEYVNADLQQVVDDRLELEAGSEAEISIRAATVVTVERLVQHLVQETTNSKGGGGGTWTAVQVDWYLWQVGEKMEEAGELKPHHRVRTIYY